MTNRRVARRAGAAAAMASLLSAIAAAFVVGPVDGQTPEQDPALPSGVVIDIDAPEDNVFQIGIPDLLGPSEHGTAGGGVLRNDFRLMPGYTVIDPRSVPRDLAEELGFRSSGWSTLGANGVIRGEVRATSEGLSVEMRFYWMGHGNAPSLVRSYEGSEGALRHHMHDFANAVLEVVTGTRGPFGTKIAFARREAPRRKDIYCAAMDGHGLVRISRGDGIALLPAFGPGRLWFTRMTPTGMFITNSLAHNRPILSGPGINMAPAVCDGTMYFTSSRDGNVEIYSATLEGTDVRRLTNDPAMDISPACGPNGTLAFVSTRHRTPQIFMMNRDGSNVRRVTFRGSHNQTPTFCPGSSRQLLAFTGRDDAYDIFTLDLGTQEYTRLTQGMGDNQDPAFSPDCRLVAFASTRRGAPGIYLASPRGNNQNRVVEGAAETVRWAAAE